MSLNKEKNFISAVVYLYNNEKEVSDFLDKVNSLLSENFEKYEIVCVNDCSTDGTVKAVEGFCETNKVKSLTVINTSFFQGVESAMVAGVDISIGDFVLEFDSPVVDYQPDMIMDVYRKSLQGNDIVFAIPHGAGKFTSKLFYTLFNRFSDMQYKIRTQRFSIISRRGINRVKSMGVKTVYRKAVYASCGLPVADFEYKPLSAEKTGDSQKAVKQELALNSLILFTDIGYKISVTLSMLMACVLLMAAVYTVTVFLSASPVAGWTTTMLVISFGFFGLFILFAFVLKYLSLILNLVFTRKQYVIESIRKITK
ncbi:MAG: glycosyltransferase [Oscillospiraceae bacterium]|nr:glycosyltransferase [Oscillospiraceae bacterium]